MLSRARATRGLRRPSLDTRSRRSSSPPLREKIEARCSFDARNRGSTRLPLERKGMERMRAVKDNLAVPLKAEEGESVKG